MSKWHAIDSLEGGIDRTVGLLFRPFNPGLWLRIALIVFIMSLSSLTSQFTTRSSDFSDIQGAGINFTRELVIMIVAVVAIFLFFSLVLQYISSVFNFVFIEAVWDRRIEFKDGFKRNLGKGLSLFLFNLMVGVGSLILIVGLVVVGVFLAVSANSMILDIILVAFGVLFLIAYLIVLSVVMTLTNDFVIPLMHFKGDGILKGWRTLADLIKADISQFVVYFLLRIALGIMAFMIEFIVMLPILLVLIAGGILVGGGSVLGWIGLTALFPELAGLTVVAIVLGLIVLIIAIIAVTYLGILITLPLPVFFRYYSILFMQRIHPEMIRIAAVEEKPVETQPEKKAQKKKAEKKAKKPAVAKNKAKEENGVKAY